MKEKLAKYLSSNISLRIFSIILAVCLWMIVINTNDPVTSRTFSNMDVTIINAEVLNDLNQTYQVVNGQKVSFSIKGKKSIVDKMKKSDFEVTADLSELSSVNAVPIKVQAKKYAEDLEIIYGNDKTLTLEIEDLQQAQVPVVAETTGEPASGYSVGQKTTNPNLINIKGPVSIVKNIKQVKVRVSVANCSSDISTSVMPICYDADGEEIDTSRIIMDVTKIKVKISIWKSKKIPLSVKTTGNPAAGYTVGSVEYEPKYIYVTGETKNLKKISKLELPAVDISGKKKSVQKTVDLTSIALPDGVSLTQENTNVMIKVNIDQSQEKNLSISSDEIQILNNTKEYQVEFQNASVSLHMKGLKGNLESATIEQLKPRIDLSGLEPGQHTVKLILETVRDVTISGNTNVSIVIREKDNNNTEEKTTEEDTASTTEDGGLNE